MAITILDQRVSLLTFVNQHLTKNKVLDKLTFSLNDDTYKRVMEITTMITIHPKGNTDADTKFPTKCQLAVGGRSTYQVTRIQRLGIINVCTNFVLIHPTDVRDISLHAQLTFGDQISNFMALFLAFISLHFVKLPPLKISRLMVKRGSWM